MKLRSLYLKAFGPFTEQIVDFGAPAHSLVLVYGPNEAGKSAMLRAIEALRFEIDKRSPDSFLHDYADMCVGGIFVQKDDQDLAVMRFKRIKAPLVQATVLADGKLQATDRAVLSGVQERMTGQLSLDEYRRMFGLDHAGLRAGGQRLAQGDVELETSLFEASLGVRDVAGIAQDLDERARELFMPGARGTKGRINEALKRHKELQQKVKASTIRPRDWQDRFNSSERARQEVQRLEKEHRELIAQKSLLASLRGAAPLIKDLDWAEEVLQELATVPALPADAGQTRTGAQASLESAMTSLDAVTQDMNQAIAKLDGLVLDTATLDCAGAVSRLASRGEEVDNLRVVIAQRQLDQEVQKEVVRGLAAAIDAQSEVRGVLARAPTKSREAEIGERVQGVLSAAQALDNHVQSAPELQDAPASDEVALPEPVIRQLRQALADVDRHRPQLARLQSLPAEIAAAEAVVGQRIRDLGLEGEDEFEQIRPMLDADIDEASNVQQENRSTQDSMTERIAQIEPDLREARAERDRMRNSQAVITLDDVLDARRRRDVTWALVRHVYIDKIDQGADSQSDRPTPEAYERDVRQADEFADGYARDTKAAAELKAKQVEIVRYERDQATLAEELKTLEAAAETATGAWRSRLLAQGLPALAPLALREWQGLLKQAREDRSLVLRLRHEQQVAQEAEQRLGGTLRAAVDATQAGLTSEGGSLSSMEGIARQLDSQIEQQQVASNAYKARRQLLEKQARDRQVRQTQLKRELEQARTHLLEILEELVLPSDAAPAAIRARLAEYGALSSAAVALKDIDNKLDAARKSLDQIVADARAVATALGVKPPEADEHLRLFIDQVADRSAIARAVQVEYQATEKDRDNALKSARAQQVAIGVLETRLKALCEVAGVVDAAQLPDIEAQSERKRNATAIRSRCVEQLPHVSSLTLDQLRQHLAQYDGAKLEALEAACATQLEDMAPRLEIARADADRARRALDEIDASGEAAHAQEELCQATAAIETSLRPWMRLRLAHSLLTEAQRRFQERAQGPMLERASGYFHRMTDGAFVRLKSDASAERQVLVAERAQGKPIGTEAMSEGTRDQLYLALRLAAVSLRREVGVDLPMVLDDVLMTSSDGRAGCVLQALADFSKGSQVIVFTHHQHLLEVAQRLVPSTVLHTVSI